jgi:hypothetical protein
MLGRLFGHTKNDRDDTVCSACGRTLLAGEWTQRVVENDGAERFICSLCAQPEDSPGRPSGPADETATVGNGRVKPARADTDVFWRALKDKDAEIERLESLLARAEAEKQELAAQLAQSRRDAESERPPEIGSDTAELVAPPFEADNAAGAQAREARDDAAGVQAIEAKDTVDVQAPAADDNDAGAPATTPLEHTDPRLGEVLRHAAAPAEPAPAADPAGAAFGEPGEPHVSQPAATPAGPEPNEFVPLTILQRGVDLLNVSAVPKRVVETNDNLGIPQVHVGAQDQSTLLITFMWSMGWYQFRVELADAGRITLADRGYEERVDLRPNASARTDGTVQLAPSQIKPPTPKDTSEAKPAGVTSGVIISKSMMGQRTDDENVPSDWKSKRAPDFDWGR